jgi:hypothetical protein
MQENYGSGAAHQQSGSKILCEIVYDESTGKYQHETLGTSNTPYIPMQTIEELYLRTDFALTQVSTHAQHRGFNVQFQNLI